MPPSQTIAEFRVAGLTGRADVEVLDDDRRLEVNDGVFWDNFAPREVHPYRLAEVKPKH